MLSQACKLYRQAIEVSCCLRQRVPALVWINHKKQASALTHEDLAVIQNWDAPTEEILQKIRIRQNGYVKTAGVLVSAPRRMWWLWSFLGSQTKFSTGEPLWYQYHLGTRLFTSWLHYSARKKFGISDGRQASSSLDKVPLMETTIRDREKQHDHEL